MPPHVPGYRIDRELGIGGMAIVYEAFDESARRTVAIKTIRADRIQDADLRARFKREAATLRRLDHPNIIALHECALDGVEPYIVTEYVDGPTLEQFLDRREHSRLPWSEALSLFAQVLDALAYAHDRNIVHRDVKPSNIMLANGRAKLADFGIALLTDLPRYTVVPVVLGSRPYMSPEQFRSSHVDRRSDIYSAGLVVYRMIAGCLPFDTAADDASQLRARLSLSALRSFVPDVPAGVSEAIAIALSVEPEQRFDSARAFAEALLRGEAGFVPMPLAHTPSAPEPPRETVPQSSAEPRPADKTTVARQVSILRSHKALSIVSLTVIAIFLLFNVALWAQWRQRLSAIGLEKVNTAQIIPRRRKTPPPSPSREPAPAPTSIATASSQTTLVTDPAPPAPLAGIDERAKREEEQRLEMRRLREQLDRQIARAESRMDTITHAELDRLAALAQRHPDDLWQAVEKIENLRQTLNDAEVARRLEIQRKELQAAAWQEKLQQIEDYLQRRRLSEAKASAKDVIDAPGVPAEVAERAKQLWELADREIKDAGKETRGGPTQNTLRKPPTPPRRNRECCP